MVARLEAVHCFVVMSDFPFVCFHREGIRPQHMAVDTRRWKRLRRELRWPRGDFRSSTGLTLTWHPSKEGK